MKGRFGNETLAPGSRPSILGSLTLPWVSSGWAQRGEGRLCGRDRPVEHQCRSQPGLWGVASACDASFLPPTVFTQVQTPRPMRKCEIVGVSTQLRPPTLTRKEQMPQHPLNKLNETMAPNPCLLGGRVTSIGFGIGWILLVFLPLAPSPEIVGESRA